MAIAPEARKLLSLRRRVEDTFDSNSWMELGILTGCTKIIDSHSRLLRSLMFGDTDYSGCVLDVLDSIINSDPNNIQVIEDYLNNGLDGIVAEETGRSVSGKLLTVRPVVFEIPDSDPDPSLLSAMMPFSREFDGVYQAIQNAAKLNRMVAERADNVWQHSTIIQDIFTLIYRSQIVVSDFSTKNTNVFYETGIAHTLGKNVIPIAQHVSELPFDLQHHRVIIYQNNSEGIEKLREKLADRIKTLQLKK